MGEHKFKETGNGDGEKPKLSTHIVEAVCSSDPDSLSVEVERAYGRLSDRATAEDSFILGVVQAMSCANVEGEIVTTVLLTAQRVSREDLERQQRLAQFGPGSGPRR